MSRYRYWTMNEITELKRLYPIMQTIKVAEKLDRSPKSIGTKAASLGLKKDWDTLSRRKMESEIYAMYKDDDLLVTGTLEEIADHQGMTVGNVRFLAYPSYHKRSSGRNRKLVFKLEE